MIKTADYLHVSKRLSDCIECGKSLIEADRHPSILLDPEEAAKHAPPPEPEVKKTPPPEAKKSARKKKKDAAGKEEDDREVFLRLDYCPDCWNKLKEQAFFSFWMGRRSQQDLPPRKLNRIERNLALLALFDSMAEKEDPEIDFTPHLFFLAHLLMKFKIFKWHPAIEDKKTGQLLLRFTRAGVEEDILVPEIEMSTETIVEIKEEIESYLEESTGQPIRL